MIHTITIFVHAFENMRIVTIHITNNVNCYLCTTTPNQNCSICVGPLQLPQRIDIFMHLPLRGFMFATKLNILKGPYMKTRAVILELEYFHGVLSNISGTA